MSSYGKDSAQLEREVEERSEDPRGHSGRPEVEDDRFTRHQLAHRT